MPFGGGPRACIGMRLALLEMKLAAVHLLQKFNFRTTAKTQVKSFCEAINMIKPDYFINHYRYLWRLLPGTKTAVWCKKIQIVLLLAH